MSTATEQKKIKKTEVTIPADTKAKVTERIGNQTVTFEAEVKQNEVEIETENNDQTKDTTDENFDFADLEREDFEPNQQIPKTDLEKMFDRLEMAIQMQSLQDSFIAMIVRQPDAAMNIKYNAPCGYVTNCGYFQFTTRDLFNFDAAIQDRNGNSGGIFNIRIFKNDQTPLLLKRNRYDYDSRHLPEYTEVGLVNYPVANPVKADIIPLQNGQSNIENMLLSYMEKTESRFESLLQQMNKPKEQSTLEKALEQKMLNDLLNPPERNGLGGFEQTMATIMAMPVMVEKMSEKMFPQPPVPVEPDIFDKAEKILKIPAVSGAVDSILNISESFAASKMANAGTNTTAQQNPAQDQNLEPEQNTEMLELLNDVIAELESDNPLDATNEFIQTLQTEFPTQADQLQSTCKIMSFDQIVQLLGAQKLIPHPFVPFLDLEQTQATSQYVWNARGVKMVERLKEFYEFVKSIE